MMKVILVRHAETEWNVRGIIQGQRDSKLTHRGECQTSALLAAFAASDYRVECVYASPLGRTWQMGQSLAESFRCSLMAEPALKEQAFGQFEGMSSAQLLQHHPNDANALFQLDAEYCPPEGESLTHASQRMMRFLYNLEETLHHQTICIVSHGHVIQGVLAMLKEGAVDGFPRYAQPNASYSVFDLINGRCVALRWGIATHLRHLEQQLPFNHSDTGTTPVSRS
ncbi:histidine phosphatase family protein [Serratia plymuthica]|uniref:histidine phosphatase family protein n=1 Tax=Serratia plymuthica TaxID=82996 RepID=UPI001BB0ACCF|nr:histidine phosphatase family protein [Serratia plymuthica]QUY48625.1 histidine phosphatase family protein [Serratia plymuthica]